MKGETFARWKKQGEEGRREKGRVMKSGQFEKIRVVLPRMRLLTLVCLLRSIDTVSEACR